MKTVALLTGKGNSALKDKNILEVCEKPLMAYPADAAKRSNLISDFFVSSDDEQILAIAYERGYKKIKRPAELARPDSQHVDAILHSLDVMKQEGVEPDILIVLLANTVCVKTEWIEQCVRQIIDDPTISSVVPVISDQDHHPYRAKRIGKGGFLEPFFDLGEKEVSSNRQELSGCFFLCHNFWVLNVKESVRSEKGQSPWKFMGDRVKPFQVEWSVDVHTEEDLIRSKTWVKANL